ncbi:lipid A deacylase LpxR family protein [Echinimonas agarilytica]|uniref:Lipid A deacylase LpxR family protein n=1 Tax=Echinimonas agarilytica TaxID=1215918 RepID=A0AA42B875_9GAMM|nr:lipid A deacylase LpxR family protein [Echinimonas agarilytica]MCM2680589.1 lipid A deacylase LpxR family protein [Echinimonas agarilytica]
MRTQSKKILSSAIVASALLSAKTVAEDRLFRFEFANDAMTFSDNMYTNGISLQWHSQAFENWQQAQEQNWFAGLGGAIAQYGWALESWAPSAHHRHAVSLSQYIQTPEDLDARDLIIDDVPYAGALIISNSWYSYDQSDFSGWQLDVGLVGPNSFAEHVQKGVHNLIGSDTPRGWEHQLKSEPIVNMTYQRKHKFWRSPASHEFESDVAWNVTAALGNFYTGAGAGLEWRWGRPNQTGFQDGQNLVGRSVFKETEGNIAKGSWHISGQLQLNYVAQDIFLDGNTWKDSHSVDKEPVYASMGLGAHYHWQNWAVHMRYWMTSNIVRSDLAHTDNNMNYGSLLFEYRY